jgi:hypothetical protein
MTDIYIFLLVFLLVWHFIYQRQLAEIARRQVKNYCEQQNLQFLAIARNRTRLAFNKRAGIHWRVCFEFEFSGDGESSSCGTLLMAGKKVREFNLPAYRV